jgi:hypothetical protein
MMNNEQKQIRTNKDGAEAAASRTSFLRRLLAGKKRKIAGAAAIFAIIILHFVSQLVFFQNENPSALSASEAVNKLVAEIKIENERQNLKMKTGEPKETLAAAVTTTKTVTPTLVQPKKSRVTPPPKLATTRTMIRKKSSGVETRADRLRRAERILTGV